MFHYAIKYPLTQQGKYDIIFKGYYMKDGQQENKEVLIHRVDVALPHQLKQNFLKILQSSLLQNKIHQGFEIINEILKDNIGPEFQGILSGLPNVLNIMREKDCWILIYPSYEISRMKKDLTTLSQLFKVYSSRIIHFKLDFKLDRVFNFTDNFILLDYGFQNDANSQQQSIRDENKDDVWQLGLLSIKFMFDSIQWMQFRHILKQNDQTTISEYLQQNCAKNDNSQLITLMVKMLQIDPSKRIDWHECDQFLSCSSQQIKIYSQQNFANPHLPETFTIEKENKIFLSSLTLLSKKVLSNNSNHLKDRQRYNPLTNSQPYKLKMGEQALLKNQDQLAPSQSNWLNHSQHSFNKSSKNSQEASNKVHIRIGVQSHRQLIQSSVNRKQRDISQNSKQNASIDETKELQTSFYTQSLQRIRKNMHNRRSQSGVQLLKNFNQSMATANEINNFDKQSSSRREQSYSLLKRIPKTNIRDTSSNHLQQSDQNEQSNIHLDNSFKLNSPFKIFDKQSSSQRQEEEVTPFMDLIKSISINDKQGTNNNVPDDNYQNQINISHEEKFESQSPSSNNQSNQKYIVSSNKDQHSFKYNILSKQNQNLSLQLINNYQPSPKQLMKNFKQQSTQQKTQSTNKEAEIMEIFEVSQPHVMPLIKQNLTFYDNADNSQQFLHINEVFPNSVTKSDNAELNAFDSPQSNQQTIKDVQKLSKILNFTKHIKIYDQCLSRLDIIGNSVNTGIKLLEALKNVWVIPMFLIFKRMKQLRDQVIFDLKEGYNPFQLPKFRQFLQSNQYEDLINTISDHSEKIDSELMQLLVRAQAQLCKLDEDSQIKLENYLNLDMISDIKEIVFDYLQSQVLARVIQVIEHLSQQKQNIKGQKCLNPPNLMEWQVLQIKILAALLVLEQPIYDNPLLDKVQYDDVLLENNTVSILQFIKQLNQKLEIIKDTLKDQYDI